MARKFRDMEPPEAEYLRRQAEAAAERSGRAAYARDQEAQGQQMLVDVYGQTGRDFSDPEFAATAARERDRQIKERDRHEAEYLRHRAVAESKPPAKKRWWQWWAAPSTPTGRASDEPRRTR